MIRTIQKPFSSRVDRASTLETVDLGSISGRVKSKTKNVVFTASLLDVQHQKRDSVKPKPCVVDRWQLDSKAERSLRCLLATATS